MCQFVRIDMCAAEEFDLIPHFWIAFWTTNCTLYYYGKNSLLLVLLFDLIPHLWIAFCTTIWIAFFTTMGSSTTLFTSRTTIWIEFCTTIWIAFCTTIWIAFCTRTMWIEFLLLWVTLPTSNVCSRSWRWLSRGAHQVCSVGLSFACSVGLFCLFCRSLLLCAQGTVRDLSARCSSGLFCRSLFCLFCRSLLPVL